MNSFNQSLISNSRNIYRNEAHTGPAIKKIIIPLREKEYSFLLKKIIEKFTPPLVIK